MWANMKTTFELPDELMREVKIRAVNENRRIKDVVTEAIRRGLAMQDSVSDSVQYRVRLPLVETAHRANTDDEMTPDKVASLLLAEESEPHLGWNE